MDWTVDAREEFRRKTEERELGDWGVDVEWEMILGKIKEVKRRSGSRMKEGEGNGGMENVERREWWVNY